MCVNHSQGYSWQWLGIKSWRKGGGGGGGLNRGGRVVVVVGGGGVHALRTVALLVPFLCVSCAFHFLYVRLGLGCVTTH